MLWHRFIGLSLVLSLSLSLLPDHCFDIKATSNPDNCGDASNLEYDGVPTTHCDEGGCSSQNGHLVTTLSSQFGTEYSILLWAVIKSTANSDTYIDVKVSMNNLESI